MRKLLLTGVFLLLAPMAALYAEVGGTYDCQGSNGKGAGKYTGTVVITGDAASGYTFNWTIGSSQYSGTGTLTDDTLTVDWGQPDPVIYKVNADGSELKGRWGPGGKGKEKLTRQ
jgi:hypothetical protein